MAHITQVASPQGGAPLQSRPRVKVAGFVEVHAPDGTLRCRGVLSGESVQQENQNGSHAPDQRP